LQLDETEGADDQRKVAALLRFHYGVDPAELDDEAYLQLWFEFAYVHRNTREMHVSALRQVLAEAFGSGTTNR